MTHKTVITISRKWDNPQIQTTITNEEISLSISLDDFKVALKKEIGSICWTFSQVTFEQALDAAIGRIVSGVKEESAKVI